MALEPKKSEPKPEEAKRATGEDPLVSSTSGTGLWVMARRDQGKTRRAIDLREGAMLDAEAFKTLIRAAVAEDLRSSAGR